MHHVGSNAFSGFGARICTNKKKDIADGNKNNDNSHIFEGNAADIIQRKRQLQFHFDTGAGGRRFLFRQREDGISSYPPALWSVILNRILHEIDLPNYFDNDDDGDAGSSESEADYLDRDSDVESENDNSSDDKDEENDIHTDRTYQLYDDDIRCKSVIYHLLLQGVATDLPNRH